MIEMTTITSSDFIHKPQFYDLNSEKKQNKFNSKLAITIINKTLQIAIVASEIISMFPVLRLAGSITSKAISFLSTCFECSEKSNNVIMRTVIKCLQLAIIVLGIVSIAIASPLLIVVALAIDIAHHIFYTINSFYNHNTEKGLLYLANCIILTFTLAGIAAGSWQVLVTATALSIVLMALTAIKTSVEIGERKKSPWDCIDLVCQTALIAIGLNAIAHLEN